MRAEDQADRSSRHSAGLVPLSYGIGQRQDELGSRRVRRLCFALLGGVLGTAVYCAAGIQLARWWEASHFLGQAYETAIVDVPFFAATSLLASLVAIAVAMRLLGRWQGEWRIVLALAVPAWLFVVFIVVVAYASAIEF
jgi:hypothetical protein